MSAPTASATYTAPVSSPLEMIACIITMFGILAFVHLCVLRVLPSRRVQELRVMLDDLDNLYNDSIEAGILAKAEAAKIRADIVIIHDRAEKLRLHALQADTLWKDLRNMSGGLTSSINRTIREVRALRAHIATASLEGLEAPRDNEKTAVLVEA